MDVLVSGSSGLVGSQLVPALEAAGHRAVRLVRDDRPGDVVRWDPDAGTIDAAGIEGMDAVIHLAGAGIGDKKWSPERKQLILESRTKGTGLLASTIAALDRKPSVMVSASAVGFYGSRGDEELTEDSPPGHDFLAGVCTQWEGATQPARDAGIRVVRIRTGILLSADGGVLKRLLFPFKVGLGGRTGTGKQWMSWIALDDEISAILHVLTHDALTGPVNLVAPNPVLNQEFVDTLGRVLARPTKLPTPLAPLKVLYGKELVDLLLLASQRVVPAKLQESGFAFAHPTLEGALRSVLGKPAAA
jgi:uncharacterized protein (TIGR01777 family)